MNNCIFCRILSDDLPGSIVYHDELCSVLMDIHPFNLGHVLVIPNQHASCLAELDPAHGMRLFQIAQRMAQALRATIQNCAGINLFLADGEAAGQEVSHVHLHVIPRLLGDGIRLSTVAKRKCIPEKAELDAMAQLLGQHHDLLAKFN